MGSSPILWALRSAYHTGPRCQDIPHKSPISMRDKDYRGDVIFTIDIGLTEFAPAPGDNTRRTPIMPLSS